jgi:hypothetical protein
MTRELALADNVAAELLGPGDVVRPWQARAPERLVPFGVRWSMTALSALGLRQPALGLGHGGSLPIGPPTAGQGRPKRTRNRCETQTAGSRGQWPLKAIPSQPEGRDESRPDAPSTR